MWRLVAPAFESNFRTVLFDYIGAGGSDLAAYDPEKYCRLSGYADDVLEIARELDLQNAVFVGHSVSAMIGILASIRSPAAFDSLVLVGPSPRYIDDVGYSGGFSEEQISGLLEALERDHVGWAAAMAPVIMGNAERPDLSNELATSFCRMRPDIAKAFASVTFRSDNRSDLAKVKVRTLVLQCSQDVIAPQQVGEFVHRHIGGSIFKQLEATGHCPNLSAPAEVVEAIRAFVQK